MKRIFGFGRKKKGQPPPGSAAQPSPAGAYELRPKDLGKLHRAAASGDLAQVRQGLKKHGIDGRDGAERTPVHLACANGHVDVVAYLVENKCQLNLFDNDNKSPLMKAVQCQQEKCVAVLLEHGADPNLADTDGNTALHLAVLSPSTTVMGLLLDHNADIDAQNKEGCTPLILAVSEHQEEIVEFLLKKGADVHARDQCERTPLMTAASAGELSLIKVLLRYGADVTHKDTNGWTAEDYAVIHGYSSLSKHLAEHADWENTGEASASGAQGFTVLGTPYRVGAAGLTLGAPAVDRGGMQQSPNQTSRTGKSRKAIDDVSQGDSVRSSEKERSDDSWHTSEEEELDFTPKKLQKPNLTLLMNASQQLRKNIDGDSSKIESPKSPKKTPKERASSDVNLSRGRDRESLNQDVSDTSNLEEEELEEEEEEDEEEEGDENDSGDDEDYEEEEEEEEEDEELSHDEKEEDDLEETQSNDILEEEQGEKTEPKEEINQKLEYSSNAKYEGEAWCGTGDVSDVKISEKLDEKVEESFDTPVSFIAGCYEGLQEDTTPVSTAVSPKIMNNEVSCKSVPKQAVFPNLNNLQDTQESWNRKSVIQEEFHRNAESCFAESEMTDWKKEIPPSLTDNCDRNERKSSLSNDSESDTSSWSAAKSPVLKSQRAHSVVLEHVNNEDTEAEEDEEVDDKVCEALTHESENLPLNGYKERLRATFHSSTKEESPEEEEKEEEQESEDSGEELQTAVVEGVKRSVLNDSHQVHTASKDNTGALPEMGAEEEEDSDSPWDSEIIQTDSESLRKVSSSVLLPAADQHGACSQIGSGERNNGFSESLNNSQLKTPESVLEMNETSPKKAQPKSDLLEEFGLGDTEYIEGEYSGSAFHMSSPAENEDVKGAIENYGVQDKYILETTNLIEKTTQENQTDKAEISHQDIQAENEESHSADKPFSPKPWEERYERMWVENEKRELKTNFKSITAELKLLFGEIKETASLVEGMSEDGFSEEWKSSCVVSSRATESSNKLESKGQFGGDKLMLGGKIPKMEIVIPSLGVLPDQNNLNANVEDSWNTDGEDGTNDADDTKVLPVEREEKKMLAMEIEENENESRRNVEESPEYFMKHNFKTSILDDVSSILPKIRPVSTSVENTLFVTERKLGKDSGFNNDVSRDCLIGNSKIGETESESLFANTQQSCSMLKRNLDEELKQDMERFKSKVGMLQMVFLALAKEKVQLQKEVEKQKHQEKCFKMQAVTKEDLDKLNTPSSNVTDQQMKQKLTLRMNDSLNMENEITLEEKEETNLASEERSKLIKMPTKGKFSLNAKVPKKNRGQTSKQKANQQMSSSSGNHFPVLEDSTFSETSEDEGRTAAKTGTEKNKVSMQIDVADDVDLTHSSNTTSEDAELPPSTYQEAMFLLEQLSVGHTGSDILLKIQSILLKYEQTIEREKNRYAAVCREVKKLESKKEESQLIAEETQDFKSVLAPQEVEWKSDIENLKFTLKQEEEKRLRVESLYEKTREKLRRKEDEYCKEMEEKRQLELQSGNLEMELMTLKKFLKQVEEERDETQRQLSWEKNARALQEGILNHHLQRQKELEEETRRTVVKNSVESDVEREKDLLYKNQLLQDEIAMLRLELDQARLRHQEEEGKYLEENETLKEKNEDLKKELKLNEEALTQTAFQYNAQLNLLKTESVVLTSKLEQTKEAKDRLETEIESFRSRLNTAVQELERHQSSKGDVERTFQRERDEWLRLQDKLHHDLSTVQETTKSLSQQLSTAESKANSLENELHQLKQTLREKTSLLETTQKELSQAQCQAKEHDQARQLEKDQVSKLMIKQESMQERLAQFQSENLLLHQQLEDMQNKGIIKEKVVNDVQDRFNEIFNKLRADTEKQVHLVEERNKELSARCTDLREQVFKYESDKVEREGMVRQLQQELADALKKQSMSEASLEVSTRYRKDLEEEKLRLQKELEKVKNKLQELEEQHLQSEHSIHDLKIALDNKEREVRDSSQKLQDLLLTSSGTNTTIKQLEEHVQRLEIENARLEATVQQQSKRIEALQRDLQASASVHNRLEDLITSLRTTQAAAEDQHQQQMQKQNMLTLTSKDLHSMWEEQLKLRSHLEERVAQLDREKAELLEQCDSERQKAKKLAELKHSVELRLDQEMERNIELQKDCKRFKRLLSRATGKLREYEEREKVSQLNLQGEIRNRYSEMVTEVGTLRTKTKTGICLLQDGNQEPFKVRLHLAKDILMIQEQDVICVSGEPFYSGERTVTIRRQSVGGFGLSIKGGAEHNIPVVISKISKEQRAELSGLLFIGDAILQINGINVRKCRHEEVVQVLRNAGEEVTLTVSFLKRAPAFLKLPLNEDCACAPSDQSSGTSSPLCDSGLHLNYHPNNTDTLSCSSWPASPGLRWEKRWCDLRLIPLLHSRFSQYLPGSDLCRQNAFQVIAVDGVCSGIIQCLSAEDCIDWLQAIASNISNLTKHNIKKINRNFPVNQQIVYMGWTEEREQDSLQDRMYTPKFLALRGSSLYKFIAPPVTTWDWTRAEKTFSVYEIMCKILKDSDLLDRRKHCFSVQSESGEDLYFSVELESDLALWEKAFQTATFLEVERIQCKTYACVLESHLMGLTIDFSMGFVCFDAATKAVLWRYKFSQLKGSSDDGKSKIKFLFQNQDTKQIEAKELEFSNLFAVLHCIHSFFAAKVACLDPLYVGSQATASAAPTTSGTGKLKYTT